MLPANKDDWKFWCRLCGTKNTEESVSVFINEAETAAGIPCNPFQKVTADVRLVAAIEKHFFVKIEYEEDLPKLLCTACFSKIKMVVNFAERISRVQHMFQVLLNCNSKINLDKDALRKKYNLLDEENKNSDDASTGESLQAEMENEIPTEQSGINIKEEEMERFQTSTGNEAAKMLTTSTQDLHMEKGLSNLATGNTLTVEEPTNSYRPKADDDVMSLGPALTANALNLQEGPIKKRTFVTQWLSKSYSEKARDFSAKHPLARKRQFSTNQRKKLKKFKAEGMSHDEAVNKMIEFQRTREEKRSRFKPTNEFIVRGLFHESSELTSRTILAHIEAQNNDVSTKSWKVLERTEDGNTVRLVCVVDNATMSQLESSNFDIWYQFGKTKLIKISN